MGRQMLSEGLHSDRSFLQYALQHLSGWYTMYTTWKKWMWAQRPWRCYIFSFMFQLFANHSQKEFGVLKVFTVQGNHGGSFISIKIIKLICDTQWNPLQRTTKLHKCTALNCHNKFNYYPFRQQKYSKCISDNMNDRPFLIPNSSHINVLSWPLVSSSDF